VNNQEANNNQEEKDTVEEELPIIQAGSDDNPFEEDLEGDEIPF